MSKTLIQQYNRETGKAETVSDENPLKVTVVGGIAPEPGSVGTEELEDKAVTTEKLADDAKAPFAGTADEANSVTWENVAGKPTAFPPDTSVKVDNATHADTADVANSVSGVSWDAVEDKPSDFPPSAHTHPISDVNGLQDELDAKLSEIADGSVTTAKLAQAVMDLINEKVKKSGDMLTGPLVFSDPNDRSKIILTKYPDGTGHSNAPTELDLKSVYLHLGGTEYANDSYRLIGFGYRHHEDTNHAPVVAGYQETNTDAADMGDFIIGTRSTNQDVAPVIRLRVTSDGQIQAEQEDYAPSGDLSLATKKYVDGAVASKLSALEPIADPTTASAEDVANAYNSLLAALKG